MPSIVKQNANAKPHKVVSNLQSRIVAVDDNADDGLKIAIYGRSATGKTTLWSTFPKPILSILCSSVPNPGEWRSIPKEDRKHIRKIVLEKSAEVFDIVKEHAPNYPTVVLDHASGLQDLILKEILGLDELPISKSWGMTTRENWTQLGVQMKELLRSLLGLTGNVVIVSQQRDFNNESNDGGLLKPFVDSGMQPSVLAWFNPAVDYIVQTFIRQKTVLREIKVAGKSTGAKPVPIEGEYEYCLRTAPHDVYTSKFRVPRGRKLPDVIIDPSYEKIMELIS